MSIKAELAKLERMTTGELAEMYAALTGQPTRTRHRRYLIRKIAWRMQAEAEGGLSQRARRRAAELADDADVRLMPPRTPTAPPARRKTRPRGRDGQDPRLPPIGSTIARRYKNQTVEVTVLADGFEYEGRRHSSLSAVAKAISGSHINGYRFFGLGGAK
jgi:hypothetical protein